MISCPNSFNNINNNHHNHHQAVSYSILIHYDDERPVCNMNCRYCICQPSKNPGLHKSPTVIDEDAMIKTILDTNKMRGICPDSYHWEIWILEPTLYLSLIHI